MKAGRLDSSPRLIFLLVLSLFFVSGFGSLVLEVLWLKELRLLFGSTAYAAAANLSAFFLGLSAGAYVWGRKAPAMRNPLRAYALLELGIAITALLYFLILKLHYIAYEPLFSIAGNSRSVFIAVKLLLALVLLFPASFLMGGTLPVLAQYLVRRPEKLGATGSLLYAVNTVGAATGAFLAGFYLPRLWGFRASYLFAVALSTGVAAAAFAISRSLARPGRSLDTDPYIERQRAVGVPAIESRMALSVALLSGFVTLSLEVLWTRMFAQVLQNSIYSFSTILVTFLISLALGAVLASVLSRKTGSPMLTLSVLIMLSGIAVALSPYAFDRLTHGLSYVTAGVGWAAYVRAIFKTAALVMFVPALLLGSILPYLFRVVQGPATSPGQVVGRLASINSIGAVLGPLVSGFILLNLIGIWASVQLMAYIYLLLAAAVLALTPSLRSGIRYVPLAIMAVLVLLARNFELPVVRLAEGETLREVWQGGSGVVAVTQQGDNVTLKLDNYYILGDLSSLAAEQLQAHIPLLLHSEPRSVFFIGLGTGITAAAALSHPVERVVATELVPNVATAARKYFAPYTSILFQDPRAVVILEDGRNYLLGTREKFDVIISDLFTPWHEGTGSLYTLEHFQTARSRLNDDGIFAQWLPLHQLSLQEFRIIARTMAEVFPQLTLWRGDFSPSRPIVALIGRGGTRPLDQETVAANVARLKSAPLPGESASDHMIGLFYAGRISFTEAALEAYPINTDDRPVIEYLSPITQRTLQSANGSYLTGLRLSKFYDELMRLVPPESDPYLQNLPDREITYVRAGLDFFKYHIYREAGQVETAQFFLERFLRAIPPELRERAKAQGLSAPGQ